MEVLKSKKTWINILLFIIAVAFPVSAALSVSGCATTQKAAHSANEAAADILLPPAEEEQLGKQMSAEIEQEMKLLEDPVVNRYVDRLGAEIVAQAGDKAPKIDFNFHVIDNPQQINAFAIPGGEIYVYSGLIKQAESEAEVIGVLGHEVAHVTKRHVAERLTAAYGYSLLASIATGGNASKLEQIVASVAQQGVLLKYGRDQEREADRIGIEYVAQAGWDPHGMVDFFSTLKAQGGARPPQIFSSHPHPEERMDRIRDLIGKMGNIPNKVGKKDHQAIQQRIGNQVAASLLERTTSAENPAIPIERHPPELR